MHNIHTQRPDFAASEVVENGITLGDRHGERRAMSYLSSHGLPDAVIERVLSHPELRRNVGRLRSREALRCEEASRYKFVS
ncbi:MAG: hypothetical protein ACEQSK_11490 [Sphingomonadaceae bacterium]